MQKVQIIGFFIENRLHRQFDVEKNSTKGYFRHIFIYIQIKHSYIIP